MMIFESNREASRGGPRSDDPRRSGGKSGFSLLELLVSILITIVIIGGVLMSFLSQRRTHINQESVAETQGNLRAGMEILKRDIRNAGFLLDDTNSLQAGNNTGLNATDQITVLSSGLGEDRIHYEVKNVGGAATLIRNTDPAGQPDRRGRMDRRRDGQRGQRRGDPNQLSGPIVQARSQRGPVPETCPGGSRGRRRA
jgi:type II secretory pathway pseudopilin PulG